MKTFLAVIGGFFALLFLAAIGFGIYGWTKIGPANEEAVIYAEETIIAVATTWDGSALTARADEMLLQNASPGKIEELMGLGARTVGDLKTLGDIECVTSFNSSTGEGTVYTSDCTVTGEHDRGSVAYTLTVRKKDDKWTLFSFNFDAKQHEAAPTEV